MIIAVLEDNVLFRDRVKVLIAAWAEERRIPCPGVFAYGTAEQLLFDWEGGREYDLMLLDLELPGMSGFQLTERIREKDPELPVIFVTALDSYLQKGYEVGVFRYLKKPVDRGQFFDCMDRVRKRIELTEPRSLIFMSGGSTVRVSFRDILCAESDLHRIRVRLTSGITVEPSARSFEAFFSLLPSDIFLRCHRSYVCSLYYVVQYSSDRLILSDGWSIPVGRKYRETVIEKLNAFFLKEAGL